MLFFQRIINTEVNKMTDTAKMAIKIASGVAIVVIAAVKIIKEKKNNR